MSRINRVTILLSVVIFIVGAWYINKVKCQNPPTEIYKTLWCE